MEMTEDELVRKIRAAAGQVRGSQAIRLGMGDDAALFRPQSGYETILTCDWFLEGTHFLRAKHPPDSVGWKCLARAVSDIAAMGGRPRCFLLNLALPASLTGRWMDAFLGGLRRASRKFQCVLAGGDTTRRERILINVTVIGEVPTGRALLRSTARPDDLIYVSGRLGEAELGLQLLKHSKQTPSFAVLSNYREVSFRAKRGIYFYEAFRKTADSSSPTAPRNDKLSVFHEAIKNSALKKHLYPEPRLALGAWLAKNRLASAMMDLSDGLSSDLPRLCAASGVGAQLEAAKIPLPRSLDRNRARGTNLLQLALHGGDDYELLFTVAPHKARLLPHTFRGIVLTPIGKITKSKTVLMEEQGRRHQLVARGWDPFRRTPSK